MQMFRRLTGLVCVLFIAVAQPAVASPRSDAVFVPAKFVKSEDYRMRLREMITKARANGLRSTLSEHSVKVRDDERLAELLSDFKIPDVVFDRLQRIVADRLIERMGPAELALLADHVRNLARDPDARRPDAKADAAKRLLTLDEFKQLPEEIAGLAEDQTFKNEIALTSVAVMTIFLSVQATNIINTDLKPSEIADLFEVDGVFVFPNRIARRDLIRKLRAANP